MALCHQKIKVGALNSLLELSTKDKERIIALAPASIAHLKHLVQDRLDHKSHDALDTAFEDKDIQDINNPIIMHAGRLGKNALRDKQVMLELWKLFKNQNKIAAFLGVNRSSVNRRCKEYQLL
jgi:DNA-binding protein Fis